MKVEASQPLKKKKKNTKRGVSMKGEGPIYLDVLLSCPLSRKNIQITHHFSLALISLYYKTIIKLPHFPLAWPKYPFSPPLGIGEAFS